MWLRSAHGQDYNALSCGKTNAADRSSRLSLHESVAVKNHHRTKTSNFAHFATTKKMTASEYQPSPSNRSAYNNSKPPPPPLLLADHSCQNEVVPTYADECNLDKYTTFALDDEWTQPRYGHYETVFHYMMASVHGQNFTCYQKGTAYLRAQLLQLQPQHTNNWLAEKAFWKVKYFIKRGDKPINARSSSLEYLKEAISFFVPYQSASWCNGQGNPTKHSMHRKLINIVKKYEV